MKRLNIFLITILVFLVFVIFLVERNYSEPNVEFMPDMFKSVPYNSQSENSNFEDGKSPRELIKGTIPKNFMPLEIKSLKDLVNPFNDEEKYFEQNSKVFSTFCQPCHGASGAGDGLVARRGFPPPPNLMADKAMSLSDGEIFNIITNGQNNMPALSGQITKEERWLAVNFVRQLQNKKKN